MGTLLRYKADLISTQQYSLAMKGLADEIREYLATSPKISITFMHVCCINVLMLFGEVAQRTKQIIGFRLWSQ